MFEIMIDAHDRTVQSSTVPVRWRTDQATLDAWQAKGEPNPLVLIIVVPKGAGESREQRFVARLNDLMRYVRFERAGANLIFAAIVSRAHRPAIMARRGGRWDTTLVDYPYPDPESGERADAALCFDWEGERAEPLEVEVPPECFAKPPGPMEMKWLTLIHDDELRDKCSVRKRRAFAYTAQPFIVAFWFLIFVLITLSRGLVAAFVLGLCRRGVNFQAVYDLPNHMARDIWEQAKPAAFMRPHLPKSGRKLNLDWLSPSSLAIVMAIAYVIFHGPHAPLIGPLSLIGAFSLAIGTGLGATLMGNAREIRGWFADRRASRPEPAAKPAAAKPADSAVRLALTDPTARSTAIGSLPARARTPRLYYDRTMGRVCKPLLR